MSGLNRNLVSQSYTTGKEGTICTENSELLKLLYENSSDIQVSRNSELEDFSVRKNKAKQEQLVDRRRHNLNSKNLQNITNLTNNSKADNAAANNLRGKNSQISAAGDANVISSSKRGKENIKTHYKTGLNKTEGELVTEGNSGDNSLLSNDKKVVFRDFGSNVLIQSLENSEANNKHTEKTVKINVVTDTGLAEAHYYPEENSFLSDIPESGSETLASSSSELARLKSPSQDSLNADFESSSISSSSQVCSPRENFLDKGCKSVESDRDISVVRSTRTAVRTPHPRTFLEYSTTSSSDDLQGSSEDEPNVTAERDFTSTSKKLHLVPSTAAPFSPAKPVLDAISPNSKDNTNDEAAYKTEATQKTSFRSVSLNETNRAPEPLPAKTLEAVPALTSPLTTVSSSLAAKGTPTPKNSKPYPVYSLISPRRSKSSFRQSLGNLSPWAGQSTIPVSPRLQQKYVTDRNFHLKDSGHSKGSASYSSQRLKTQKEVTERSGTDLCAEGSLDGHREENEEEEEETKFDADSLDIERDSLEVNQTESKNILLFDDRRRLVYDNSNREGQEENKLKSNLEHHNSGKLEGNTDYVGAGSNRVTGANIESRTVSAVDLPTSAPTNGKPDQALGVISGLQRYTDDDSTQSVGRQVHHIPAQMSPEEPEQVEYVIKSDMNKQGVSRYYTTQGSAHSLRRNSDPSASAGSVTRNSNRTTPSVKKLYIESPTFTREEEEVYRFVSSRLEDNKDEGEDTYRELDMAAIENQENHALRVGTQKRVRYSDAGGRYEDTDGHDDEGKQGPPEGSSVRPVQTNMRKYISEPGQGVSDKENQFDRQVQGPANQGSIQFHQQQLFHLLQHNDPKSVGIRNSNYGNTNTYPEAYGGHKDNMRKPGQEIYENQPQGDRRSQWDEYHSQRDLAAKFQLGQKPSLGSVGQQGFSNNQRSPITQQGFSNSQQEYGRNDFPQQLYPQVKAGSNVPHQPQYLNQQEQQSQPASKPVVRGLSLPVGPSYDPVDEEELKRETFYQQGRSFVSS